MEELLKGFTGLTWQTGVMFLIGGILIGVGANSIYCAAYTGIGVASALELKDKLWGGKFDLIDWVLTVIGVAIGYLIRFGIISILL